MAMVPWDPWHEIEDMFDRYTRAVGLSRVGNWGRRALGAEPAAAVDWAPRVDISETPAAYVIKAEIPEVKKEDVKITIDAGTVTISGERRQETEQKDTKYHRVERYYGSFSRSFSLPGNVDEQAARAEFKEGVLSLSIPKAAEAKPKVLEVKVQ
ncbi:MAG: Hsp20/alpha crystallin family protein [Betaproteobacteria bacterium]|nr:Hsp20/alpha crystallin family protein [Betaproteobacteria bacterium]MBU6511963.1 Hsp20/alpha crystallin family protein [Betaproteobacteria bacterium]MDE1957390.1 Hsp20/alpha crystallin family protein [Betaproteobacteria bacterium]MDE2152193.1 Hsp20/alpha crystallin family protein [Betaproteobacteria bacterium]MDE2479770.1 Hsp20/alpha crystallin family protein [Betaproteobacteria bacterium]